MARQKRISFGNGAKLCFEPTLCQATVDLRDNMDAGEYKHVLLRLVFRKYISDAFVEQHNQL